MKKNEATPNGATPDPWKAKLQEVLKSERPSRRRLGFWLGIALLAGLGVVAWLVWPRETLPLPPVVAFDVLAATGEPVHVRGMFDVEDAKAVPVLTGRDIVFQEGRLPMPGEELALVAAKVEKSKWGRGVLNLPADFRQGGYEVRVPGKDRQEGVKDQAHVFVRPPTSRLLIVSVMKTLALAELDEWSVKDPRDIVPATAAFPALHAARAAGWEIVYIALEPDRPLTYQKMRGWARSRFGPAPGALPEGPVLGRANYPDDLPAAYRDLAKALGERFAGPHVAVTASADVAQRLQAAGVITHLIGAVEAPAGVGRMDDWETWGRVIGAKK